MYRYFFGRGIFNQHETTREDLVAGTSEYTVKKLEERADVQDFAIGVAEEIALAVLKFKEEVAK